MIPLIVTLFAASILGSLHCAGMCGPFLAIAVGGSNAPRLATQSAYHGGRLITYTLLGALAGAAGQLVNLGSTLAGIQPLAAALAGATMLAFGVVTLLRLWGWKLPSSGVPSILTKLLQQGHRAASSGPPVARALAIGLLTTLLPCGWLYAFVIVAAGTASAPMGALTMAVFWAGTLPILVALGAGVQKLMGSMGRHVQSITAVLLVLVGLYTLTGRLLLDPVALARQVHPATQSPPTSQPVPPCCQHHDHAH